MAVENLPLLPKTQLLQLLSILVQSTLLNYFPWLAHFRLSGMDSQPLYLCMVSVAIMYIAVNGPDIIFNLNSSLLFSSQL